jgi:hypothetical protein
MNEPPVALHVEGYRFFLGAPSQGIVPPELLGFSQRKSRNSAREDWPDRITFDLTRVSLMFMADKSGRQAVARI